MALQEGNDSAQPQAGDAPVTVIPDTAAPAAPASGIQFIDVDDLELQDAKAAVKTEEAAGQGNPEAIASPGTATVPAEGEPKPEGQPATEGQGSKPGQPVPTIPKPRFDEVLTERDKAMQDAAYWRGQAEARMPPATGPAAGQQPTAPTFEQRLTDLHKASDALAQKFDNGEITMAEFKRQERALTEYEANLREEKLTATLKPAPAQANDSLYLETLTAQLETEHPWVQVFEKVGTKADWDLLRERAASSCIEDGLDPSQGQFWVVKLREKVATLCDELGPSLVGGRAQKQGITLPTQQQQQQPGAAPLSPQAKAMADKLKLQREAPVDVSAMTGASNANTGGIPTAAQLDSMSDDDIGKLPQAVRNKLLGVA